MFFVLISGSKPESTTDFIKLNLWFGSRGPAWQVDSCFNTFSTWETGESTNSISNNICVTPLSTQEEWHDINPSTMQDVFGREELNWGKSVCDIN